MGDNVFISNSTTNFPSSVGSDDWILLTGDWNDSGTWFDTDNWID